MLADPFDLTLVRLNNLGLNARKPVFRTLRTTKGQLCHSLNESIKSRLATDVISII